MRRKIQSSIIELIHKEPKKKKGAESNVPKRGIEKPKPRSVLSLFKILQAHRLYPSAKGFIRVFEGKSIAI
jgi:hypothetical protein